MTMLYRAVEGSVKETKYGLALAHLVPLPPQVLSDATYFAHKLERRLAQKKKVSQNVINERRRKLILDLKEHLVQAYNGTLEGELLATWLKELQKEFVNRMTAINEDESRIVEDEDEESESDIAISEDSTGDQAMLDIENESQVSGPESRDWQPTIISIDSRITSTESSSTIRKPSSVLSSVRAVSENEV